GGICATVPLGTDAGAGVAAACRRAASCFLRSASIVLLIASFAPGTTDCSYTFSMPSARAGDIRKHEAAIASRATKTQKRGLNMLAHVALCEPKTLAPRKCELKSPTAVI